MSTPTKAPSGTLDRVFHLSERHTDVKTEIIAGVTTFMTMAYILAVNPNILSEAGMDRGAVFTATCLASILATILMAVFSNYPFVLSAGMGLNAYFAYTVVLNMGYTWQMALAAVFVEGVIFILLSLTKVREAIFNAIPMPLKHAVSAGIGLFIAFIGLQNCKLVVANPSTKVSVYNWHNNAATFNTEGITVLLAVIGVLITAVLVVKRVKGNILWGILATWILGILCELVGLYVPNPDMGFFSVLPSFANGIGVPSVLPTLGQLDFSAIIDGRWLDFLVVIFAFLFVDMFDTLGTLIGVASKADMLDKDGKLPKIRGALLADAVGTSAGALLGTSTITTFVESASGVSEGGRTGLVSAALFGVALFLSPIFLAIPSFATAPALIVVGFLMVSAVLKIDLNNPFEGIPAFICIMAMPFMYSISEGIAMGTISYVVINLFGGKERRKTISIVMYILAILFVVKYIVI